MTGPVVSIVANPVLALGIATSKSVQFAPNGPPTSFGPTGQQVRQQDGGDPRDSTGHQGQDLLPLFDDQQLRRFAEIYQQAPMVYPSADFVRRPAFLVRDGRDQEAREGRSTTWKRCCSWWPIFRTNLGLQCSVCTAEWSPSFEESSDGCRKGECRSSCSGDGFGSTITWKRRRVQHPWSWRECGKWFTRRPTWTP